MLPGAAARSPRLGEVVTIDAIVWDGLEVMRDHLDIVFLELTGQAQLNYRQRRI